MGSPPVDYSYRRFRDLASLPSGEVPLFSAALLISSLVDGELRDGWWREFEDRFDRLVDDCRLDVALLDASSERERFAALVRHFCNQLRFAGDSEEYHAPRNSALTIVLERRRGLPITLAVLLVELARRLGFKAYGVGAPGHFLAGATVDGEAVFVDVFAGTPELLNAEQAAWCVSLQTGRSVEAVYPFLVPAEPREILVRMLNNLKVSFSNTGELSRLARVLTWLLELEPNNLAERRNRGIVLLRLGQNAVGAADLLEYLAGAPDAEDEATIRHEVERALSFRSQLN